MSNDFIIKALHYLEYEYKEEVLPMGPYFHQGDMTFYLSGARLYRLTPSYSGDRITPLLISLEKIFS